jgi:superfamily II DNA or RNA helicase
MSIMDNVAKIVIEDECNIHITQVDLPTKKALVNSVKYFIPSARYSPAFKMGRWDGTQSYCTLGGKSYLSALDKLLPVLQDKGYEIEIDDRRVFHEFDFEEVTEDSLSHISWPFGHRFAGEPIMLRDYQVSAINTCLQNVQGIQVLPTSAGKTIVTATLSKMVEPYGRTIVIVPNKNLVQQTEEDYRNLGLDVGVLYGDRKEYDCTHTICTWQSLNVLDKKQKDCLDNDQMSVFLKDIMAVIVDECHMVKDLNVLHKLLTGVFNNVPIRWGLTGTVPEEEYKQMGLFTGIGPLIGTLSAKELQDKGVLAQCNVHILQTQETLQYNNYQEELKYLVTDTRRLAWLAQTIEALSQSGNTLVLVDRIETGQKLYNQLSGAVFISGEMKSKDRRAHYKEINFADNKIMVATYGTTSTGISINRIFNLVLVEAGKSFVRTIQSIGRGLRMADDKSQVEIYDVCSKMKFSNSHSLKRKAFYKTAEYPFQVTKITY